MSRKIVPGDNSLLLNPNGTLEMYGEKGWELLDQATVWDDLRVEPTVRGTGAKAPSYVAYKGGIYAYEFDNALLAAEKEVNFKMQMPHSYKEGTNLRLHVHWVAKSTTNPDEKVRWGFEYTIANINGVFGDTNTIYSDTPENPPSTTPTADTHYLTAFAPVSMTNNLISTFILGRIFRNSSDAADTYTDSVYLIGIDAHVEINTAGSKELFKK